MADAWASIDGKLHMFREGKAKVEQDGEPGDIYAGYINDALEMVERLRKRGYKIMSAE